MQLKFTSYLLAASISAMVGLSGTAFAQELDAAHVSQAKKALAATKATNPFDQILPKAALDLKNQFSSTNPDQFEQIDLIVDEEAIKLASRRGDLETESAKLFAGTFSLEELKEIEAFFSTPTGEKYLKEAPILAREMGKAVRIWETGIRRDLAAASGKRLSEISQ